MTRLNLSLLLLLVVHCAHAQWKPVPGKISTEWAAKVNPSDPLPEYPRPQMVRKNWVNLNGLWQYAILPKGSDQIPASYTGQILVPYAVESSLSGVGKTVGENNVLWYNRSIDLPAKMAGGKLLLHFGAVDWSCKVYVNEKLAGEHAGGYDAFSFDITSLIKKGAKQNISVQVWDPSDDGPQPRGKQVKQPKGIWYTPVTGIWQTVWLENVPQTYIVATKQTPDIDKKQLAVRVEIADLQSGDQLEVSAWEGAKQVALLKSADPKGDLVLNIPDPKLWSPASPFLYDLKVAVKRKGKTIDEVGSYFGMRKSAMAKDAAGIQRMMLNNQFVFQYGPLDQGWWPDGLYTAPTDEALKFDIEKTKALGFNMIRKHVKVEPARWYYHCDKMGMLVWQDMPSGDTGGNVWDAKPGFITGGQLDKDRSPESENIFRKEWKAIMDQCHNYPSIVSWVPFNEAWGQFKTKEIVDWTMKYDPSRLVNAASGGNYFMGAGQVFDLHIYPAPAMPDPAIYGARQALVLGEFGGLGLPVEGHTWLDKGNWGYQSYKNKEDLFKQYTKFISAIPKLIRLGLSAAVYTQTTDVEIETNGLFTYDRKVLKMPLEGMYQLHRQLYDASLVKW
ncbi:glycoside hydrolase family 2 protein [Pedobacter heparinus]|uniref:glycoside hydrolase family 2 protein n=1 Tax=Pedobacter heparinus TaxID=984 RepID=UPI00292FBAF2|nr:sugar-binding domain-containing protein [Pedobacter heparinus]